MILIREDKNGAINLRNHPTLRSFPLRKVREDLWLEGCKSLRSLPPTLEVGWFLDLEGCQSLTRLPAILRVGGSLWIRDTPISELPTSLVVGEDLYLRGSKITHVPKSAKIGGRVYGLGET